MSTSNNEAVFTGQKKTKMFIGVTMPEVVTTLHLVSEDCRFKTQHNHLWWVSEQESVLW